MARIHGIAGSTKYLLKRTRPIGGRPMESLGDVQHFLSHYEEILARAEAAAARKQDERIVALKNEEARLGRELEEALARRTAEVDREIAELDRKARAAGGFLAGLGYRVRHWLAVTLRTSTINRPLAKISRELRSVRSRKEDCISGRQFVIQRECREITDSYEFLLKSKECIAGANGEEQVIRALAGLPDDYHVLNDVNLRFDRGVYWKKYREYIKTCQIDHIVAGPAGIFLLETKNWKITDLDAKSEALARQVERANFALWSYTRDLYPKNERLKVWNVLVPVKGAHAGWKLGRYIDVVAPRHLCDHIANRKATLSKEAVEKFVNVLSP